VERGFIRLKGLLVFGATALSLGYMAPTVGSASGPAAPVPAQLDVVIRDGNHVTVAKTQPGTVADALAASGIRLTPKQTTEPPPGAALHQGMQVAIVPRTTAQVRTPHGSLPVDARRDALAALAEAGLSVHGGDVLRLGSGELMLLPSTGLLIRRHGRLAYARVIAPTLAQALAELGIDANPDDRLSVAGLEGTPLADLPIFEGMRVDLVQVARLTRTARQAVPFNTRQVDDPALAAGTTVVEQEGIEGERSLVTEVLLQDGEPVAERVVSDEITRPPRDRVLRRGTRPRALPEDGAFGYVLTFVSSHVTAYCLRGTTATGSQVGPGTIAVDPTRIPLGSHLYVEGYGFGYALDTGGDIKGEAVDLWIASCDDAVRWGRRTVRVYVLDH
jgi:uncharacterized protein YabE (DUF348 family)/3D (Asp-Asp-Asp) domain-containing protein